MQYTVAQIPPGLDLGLVTEMLLAFDPRAVVDIEGAGSTLRFSTSLATAVVIPLLKAAGIPLARPGAPQARASAAGACGIAAGVRP